MTGKEEKMPFHMTVKKWREVWSLNKREKGQK